MKYSLFLGCTIPVRGQNYELSARKVSKALGIELVDNFKYGCCGFPVKAVNQKAALFFAARNLALAEKEGLNIMTLCSACTGTLTETNHRLREDETLRRKVNEELSPLGLEYTGKVEVKHFARILYEDYGIDKIKEKIKRKLEGFKFAAYYGCHYLKPSEAFSKFDDPENPKSLDELIKATGAETVYYENKLSCCGGAVLGINENTALEIAHLNLEHVKNSKADAMIVICPFCDIMHEQNQKRIAKKHETELNIPVLYYPQILGLALGFKPEELGFNINRIKPKKLLEAVAA